MNTAEKENSLNSILHVCSICVEIKNKIPKKETLFPENYSRVQINVVLLDFDVLQSPQGPCVTADSARLIYNTAERHTVGALGGGMVMKLIHTEN